MILNKTDEIPIPFPFKDMGSLDPMFGPAGLYKIVSQTLAALDPDLVSFTLEIHPQEGRIPLGPYAHLFTHWKDKTNGERMNYWLNLLLNNHFLVREACKGSPKNNFTFSCVDPSRMTALLVA